MSPSNQQAQIEKTLVDQTNLLPRARLIIVFGTLAFAFLITYADQNGIAVILPTMARDLNAQDTISWAGTSSFVGNTVFQVLYGRLSDLFGRKVVYLSALLLLAVGDILCATAQNGTSLYVFRALAGIAMGGINSLTMIIVSDIVTLQQRGYYQGLLGGCIGLGNIIGPFVSAAFAETSSWRNFFYLIGPLAAASAVLSFFLIPSSMPPRKRKETFSMIDYYGIVTGSTAIIFFLVPISGGGSYFNWSSPMVISMLAISAFALVAFLLVEWKVAHLPYRGAVSMCFFSRTTDPAIIGIVGAITGAGVGNVFQPCLIALQAHSPKAQRAVVISNRNFLRSLGGAVGLAVSAQVMQSSLRNSLPPHLRSLVSSSYSIPNIRNIPATDLEAMLDAYMTASRNVFILLAPFMGLCLLGCFLVKDQGLSRKEEGKEEGKEEDQVNGQKRDCTQKDAPVQARGQGLLQEQNIEMLPSRK
ncbi:MFS general substrate transporter [Lizonia empirigonia]|nr:MFS general substrate transporter [Lizonia empirigonia]